MLTSRSKNLSVVLCSRPSRKATAFACVNASFSRPCWKSFDGQQSIWHIAATKNRHDWSRLTLSLPLKGSGLGSGARRGVPRRSRPRNVRSRLPVCSVLKTEPDVLVIYELPADLEMPGVSEVDVGRRSCSYGNVERLELLRLL